MKKLAYIACIALTLPAFITMQGCGEATDSNGTDTTATTTTDVVPLEGTVEFDMSDAGFAYKMMVPNEDQAKATPEISYNEDAGYFAVVCGEHFSITITEDEPDFALLKEDLNTHLLYKTEFLKDEADLLIYESTLPDESNSYVHFYLVKELNGMKFVIEDEKMGDFTQGDIDKMVQCARSISPVTPA